MSEREVKEVAALRYSPESDAVPVVTAVGRGHVAEKILEAAKEHDIPIVPDASLAHILSSMGVGDEIPEELYTIVAQVLLFVSQMDASYRSRFPV